MSRGVAVPTENLIVREDNVMGIVSRDGRKQPAVVLRVGVDGVSNDNVQHVHFCRFGCAD